IRIGAPRTSFQGSFPGPNRQTFPWTCRCTSDCTSMPRAFVSSAFHWPHRCECAPTRSSNELWSACRVRGDDVGDAGGELLRVVQMQEFVGAVRVGVRAEHAGDEELRLREL